MNEELKNELMESTVDVDAYLNPPPIKKGMRVGDVETLAKIANEDTLREWFISSYKLLKKLQAEVDS